jgi:hypothetical protein
MEGIMPTFTGQMDVPEVLQKKVMGTEEYLNLLKQAIGTTGETTGEGGGLAPDPNVLMNSMDL